MNGVVVDAAERSALSDAVAALHGAVYAYGVIAAFAPPAQTGRVDAALRAHTYDQNEVTAALGDGAPVAAPAYDLPVPVTDAGSALSLALRIETDIAVAWRSVLERSRPEVRTTPSPPERTASTDSDPAGAAAVDPDRFTVRAAAVRALTDCAVRAVQWRVAIGRAPTSDPFPGTPSA